MIKTLPLRAALLVALAQGPNATLAHRPASRGGRSRATTSLLVVLAIVCCAVAACLKSKRPTIEEKPIAGEATIDEESKESPDELSASRHAKPIKPVEAVPEDTRVRAVSFDIEQPVVSPLRESRANSSKWSLAKPST